MLLPWEALQFGITPTLMGEGEVFNGVIWCMDEPQTSVRFAKNPSLVQFLGGDPPFGVLSASLRSTIRALGGSL